MSASTPGTSPTIFRTTLAILCVASGLMGVLLALLPAAGHDQLWFLLMAQRWIDGAALYGPQIFDSNPPAIVWASAVPVFLGQWLHVPASLPAKLLVLPACGASAVLSFRILRRLQPAAASFERAALTFACLTFFLVLPARDFGQRDHLLAIFILPYVLASTLPLAPALPALRAAAGILAAAGICLKPQYAIIPVALELFLLVRPQGSADVRTRLRTLLRPEPLILLVTGAAYLGAMRAFAPLYFSATLPILRDTYWAVGHLNLPALALEAVQLCVLAAVAIGLFLPVRARSSAVSALLVAGTAAAAAYFFQGTGWYYQQLPSLILFGAALALQLLEAAKRNPPELPPWTPKAAVALSFLALALTTHFMGYPFTKDRAFAIETPDPSFFIDLPPQTSIAMLTTSVDATMMPVERFHLLWAQRTNNLWLLPAILRGETSRLNHPLTPERLSALEALQHRWMVEDLSRWRPQVVLVERCQAVEVHCQLLEDRYDNLLAWFLRDPAFAGIWQHYHFVRSSGRFDEYALAI